MTVYVTCDECGDFNIIEGEMYWHECECETDGYDPLEPWMDNDLS